MSKLDWFLVGHTAQIKMIKAIPMPILAFKSQPLTKESQMGQAEKEAGREHPTADRSLFHRSEANLQLKKGEY